MKIHKQLKFYAAMLALAGTQCSANAQTAYAINDNLDRQLIRFDVATPGNVTVVGTLLADGFPIELDALDFSLSDGNLYGYSYQYDEIFRVDPATGVLTSAAISNVFTRSRGLGFEFQPVSGGFQLVNDAGDNFRFTSAFVGAVQTPLAYAPGDVRFGTTPRVGDIAFANSVVSATTTALYGIDYGTDSLVRIGGNPATADGTANDPAVGRVHTIGALGFNTSDYIGFDIANVGGVDTGFAILTPPATPTSPRLYRVNLTSGAATQVGTIGGGVALFGFALQPSQVNGMVQFEGQTQALPKTVRLTFQSSTGQNISVLREVPASGMFSLVGVPAGTYTLNISAERFLAKNLAITVTSATTDTGTILLRAGDANNDNFADIQDLLLLIAHYNQAAPSAEYLEATDFNSDTRNDIADLLLLIANYNAQGESLP